MTANVLWMNEGDDILKLVSFTCAHCGAKLEVDSERERCFCMYCGTQFAIDSGNRRIEIIHRNIDETEIEKVRYLRERERNRMLAKESEQKLEEKKSSNDVAMFGIISFTILGIFGLMILVGLLGL